MLSPETIDIRSLIADYLRQRFPGLAGVAISDATPLLSNGMVDSLGILDLTTFLHARLGIELTDEDYEPENFETFGHLVAFTERKRS